MRYVLVGNRNKRLDFFQKACEQQEVSLHFIDMEDLLLCETQAQMASYFLPDDIVKIDPVANFGISIEEFHQKIKRYQRALELLCDLFTSKKGSASPILNDCGASPILNDSGDLPDSHDLHDLHQSKETISFLNSPDSILQTLNKRACKQILMQTGLPVTPMLDFRAHDFEELLFCMKQTKSFQLFIKPLLASGAGGIIALRYQPNTDRFLAQSAMFKQGRGFVNTKKIRTFRDKAEIKDMVDFILKEDCIFERWMAKDQVKNTPYDLRVLYQFDEICFIQARGAKNSAITNLHLNNMPITLEQTALPKESLFEIERICKRTMQGFDGLRVAGFDFLIELHSKKPYIIEINAQGDLIYSDIYSDNTIYRKQVEWMKSK